MGWVVALLLYGLGVALCTVVQSFSDPDDESWVVPLSWPVAAGVFAFLCAKDRLEEKGII